MVETIKEIEKRIDDLVIYLNDCTKLYDEGNPPISDQEWDDLYFKLVKWERMTKYIRSDSPTQKVNYYTTVDNLPKVEHSHPMLSLDKTKSMDAVTTFLGKKNWIAMLKMDGLTCSLLYENGKLVRAETRGNGIIGEDITHNAMVIPSIPKRIPYKETLIVDGEIICKLDDFEEFANDYKNSRNFAAGSIRLLDSSECAKRKLTFVAWDRINKTLDTNLSAELAMLWDYGFTVVPYLTHKDITLDDTVDTLTNIAKKQNYPIDGIVYKYDYTLEYERAGRTDHHFRGGMAYKFYDELYKTELLEIEWSMGRTGVLTPVAIFEPIDIDGSTVERASVHNLSVMKELFHGIPFVHQEINVFKSNMIIPQIHDAADYRDSPYYPGFYFLNPPTICPICGGPVAERTETDSTVLVCENPSCEGKLINRLDHFCGKKGLDIKGISKATLEKLIDWNWIQKCSDIFKLFIWAEKWIHKPGFGIKSVQKILDAIEASKECELHQFIAALGIPLIGTTASKELTKVFPTWEEFIEAVDSNYAFYQLPNFGFEMHSAIHSYDYEDAKFIANNFITFKSVEIINNNEQTLDGQVFVITGKLNQFKNRDEISNLITSLGGKVTGSVSKNTTYLINNDVNSTSSKNKTAKSLGIPILSEDDFIQTFGIMI